MAYETLLTGKQIKCDSNNFVFLEKILKNGTHTLQCYYRSHLPSEDEDSTIKYDERCRIWVKELDEGGELIAFSDKTDPKWEMLPPDEWYISPSRVDTSLRYDCRWFLRPEKTSHVEKDPHVLAYKTHFKTIFRYWNTPYRSDKFSEYNEVDRAIIRAIVVSKLSIFLSLDLIDYILSFLKPIDFICLEE